MPALHSGSSPTPGNPSQSPSVRSALDCQDGPSDDFLGFIFKSCERRLPGQDAVPQTTLVVPRTRRGAKPARPRRPSSATLAGTRVFLDCTVRPSVMRIEDVEAWLDEAVGGNGPFHDLHLHPPTPEALTPFPSLEQLTAYDTDGASDAKPKSARGFLKRFHSSSLPTLLASDDARKDVPKSSTALYHGLENTSWPHYPAPRNRLSQTSNRRGESETSSCELRGSMGSGRQALRRSNASSQRSLQVPCSPPPYRSLISSFHRRFYSTDSAAVSSDSSWTSFGCVDGMRRPDLEAQADEAPEAERKEDKADVAQVLRKCASRLMLRGQRVVS